MIPHLVALNDGPEIVLNKPILLVGRHQECDIQIPSRKISRRHCCLAQVDNTLVVRDLGSTNGIRVNGVRLAEGKLHEGDELTIGNVIYQFRVTGEPPAGTKRDPSEEPSSLLETGGQMPLGEPPQRARH